jgi:glycosyltransferase involved in cell wall biosynthesis
MDKTTAKVKVVHIAAVDLSLRYLLLNQMLALQAEGYEVASVSAAGPHFTAIEAAGVPHIAIPISRNVTPLADLVSLWRLYRLMRREKFAIVHTHTPKAGLLGQLAARLAGVPVVVNTLHGLYLHDNMRPLARRFYITLERIAALCSHVILSQNREDIQTVIRERISPPQKIKHLGNGIDIGRYDPDRFTPEQIQQKRLELNIPEDAIVVGFVGRLAARRKGFRDFLAAGKTLAARNPNIRFLIIGDVDHGKPDAVEPETAYEYGIGDQCLFLGFVPNEQLPIFYKLMHVLVLPSLFEGVPRAVMEATAMGVPAVVTDVKGNREAVEQNQNGFLVPLGDVAALADAIYAIVTDFELARRMGQMGRQMAKERFDERLVFTRVQAEYARLLRQKGLPVPAPAQAA